MSGALDPRRRATPCAHVLSAFLGLEYLRDERGAPVAVLHTYRCLACLSVATLRTPIDRGDA